MSDPHTHSEPHSAADHAHDVSKHVRAYWIVGSTLLVFTIITVALSYIDFGNIRTNIVVAMIVAAFKAGLVAAIFMHLLSEKKLIYQTLIFTVIFVIGLFFLTWLNWVDPIPGTTHWK